MPDISHRILRKKAVSERTGLPHATIYRYMDLGKFPKPIELGPGTVGWLECEIDAWLEARIAARDEQQAA